MGAYFMPMLLMSIGMAIPAGLLAKNKGRSVVLWVVLHLIPVVNFFCMPYLIGVSNLRFEKKLDSIMAKLDKSAQ